MDSSGVFRRIDELGRIVIPVEIRKNLNIKEGENLEFTINNNQIILKKKSYVEDNNNLFITISKSLSSILDGDYFISDRTKVISSSNKNIINKDLTSEFSKYLSIYDESIINGREISIVDEYKIFSTFYIYPLLLDNNIIGLICLYNVDNIDKYNKLVRFISSFVSNKLSINTA